MLELSVVSSLGRTWPARLRAWVHTLNIYPNYCPSHILLSCQRCDLISCIANGNRGQRWEPEMCPTSKTSSRFAFDSHQGIKCLHILQTDRHLAQHPVTIQQSPPPKAIGTWRDELLCQASQRSPNGFHSRISLQSEDFFLSPTRQTSSPEPAWQHHLPQHNFCESMRAAGECTKHLLCIPRRGTLSVPSTPYQYLYKTTWQRMLLAMSSRSPCQWRYTEPSTCRSQYACLI